jgi:hypothetical protein
MATIQIRDEYTKAIGLLYEMGGMFRTKPTRPLVVGPVQLQVLQQAGLIPHANGAKKTWEEKIVAWRGLHRSISSRSRVACQEITMPTVQIRSFKKYAKAIGILLVGLCLETSQKHGVSAIREAHKPMASGHQLGKLPFFHALRIAYFSPESPANSRAICAAKRVLATRIP